MERWVEKVAVVTGASSGIGSAITVELIRAGMIVCGISKRKDKVELLRGAIIGLPGELNSVECDITNEEEVKQTFIWIQKKYGRVDVLINNAAFVSKKMLLDDGNIRDLRLMLETNILGLIICTKQALKMMKENAVQGVIVNINSVLGHKVNTCVPGTKPVNGMYPACKFALTAMTECLRQEIIYKDMYAKVMSISPGLVEHDIISSGGDNDLIKLMPTLDPIEVAKAVMYVMCTPTNVLIQDVIIKPEGEFI